jgi:hypothetical protein
VRLRRKLHRLRRAPALVLIAALLLPGCLVARVATAVVVLPVKLVGAGIDAAVTTDAERDQARGKAERKQEEADAKAARKQAEKDAKGAIPPHA